MRDLFLRKKLTYEEQKKAGLPSNITSAFIEGENDIYIGVNGDIETVTGNSKLKQDILKILLTERGNNLYSSIYGSQLQYYIGKKYDDEFIKSQIKTEIVNTLRVFQYLNKSNTNGDEAIDTLEYLSITKVGETRFDIKFQIKTMSGNTLGLGFSIGE
jgi:hypothetical protein